MNNYKTIIVLSVLITALNLSSCKEHIGSQKELFKWMNDPENGLIKKKTIGGLDITVRYLPSEYLVLKDLKRIKNFSSQKRDSISEYYRHSRTFLLSLSTNEASKNADVMLAGVGSREEFAERAELMNFKMGEYVSLKTERGEYSPVLSTLENVYGLSNSRNIFLVFSQDENQDDLLKAAELDFVFDDPVYNTGINHFSFKKNQIESIPELNFTTLYDKE